MQNYGEGKMEVSFDVISQEMEKFTKFEYSEKGSQMSNDKKDGKTTSFIVYINKQKIDPDVEGEMQFKVYLKDSIGEAEKIYSVFIIRNSTLSLDEKVQEAIKE